MRLPAIREKISQLPRSFKILLPVLFIFVIIIIVEGSYYLWILRKSAGESKYINTDLAYQQGLYLYNRETGELIAIRGWVNKIDGWSLTVENQKQTISIEINKEFDFSKITEEPNKTTPPIKRDEIVEGDILEKELIDKGFLMASEKPLVGELNELIFTGDYVVIKGVVKNNSGKLTGESISVLEFMKK